MQQQYPGLGDRIQSIFIDTTLLIILTFVFSAVLEKFDHSPDWIKIALFAGLWAVYEPVCTTIGGTVGNLIKGIRVRRYNSTDKRINLLQAYVRYIVKLSLGWLSFITIFTNEQRRAIHDLLSGSVMINV